MRPWMPTVLEIGQGPATHIPMIAKVLVGQGSTKGTRTKKEGRWSCWGVSISKPKGERAPMRHGSVHMWLLTAFSWPHLQHTQHSKHKDSGTLPSSIFLSQVYYSSFDFINSSTTYCDKNLKNKSISTFLLSTGQWELALQCNLMLAEGWSHPSPSSAGAPGWSGKRNQVCGGSNLDTQDCTGLLISSHYADRNTDTWTQSLASCRQWSQELLRSQEEGARDLNKSIWLSPSNSSWHTL
jgi:hypothetical protein